MRLERRLESGVFVLVIVDRPGAQLEFCFGQAFTDDDTATGEGSACHADVAIPTCGILLLGAARSIGRSLLPASSPNQSPHD